MEEEEECNRDLIFFDRRRMFVEYRKTLEPVSSLECPVSPVIGLGPASTWSAVHPPEEEDNVEEIMPEENTNHNTMDREELLVVQPPSGTVVYQLFRYLQEDVIQRLLVPTTELIALIRERCPSLVPDTERRLQHFDAMLRAYVKRFLLLALTLDERGGRMLQILNQLEGLYLCWGDGDIEGAKNNYNHLSLLHQLLEQVTRESLNRSTDQFYLKCADAKRRGRRPGHESANPPHPLNQLKAEYILSHKSAPPVVYNEDNQRFYLAYKAQQPVASSQLSVDYYPVFLQELRIVNDCVPRHDNHGWFLEKCRLAAKQLTPRDWPMHGLMQSLLNLQAVVERRRVHIRYTKGGKRHYCAYTGLQLQDGEEVWFLKLLVLCPKRHRVWQRQGLQSASKTDDPLLLPSLRCYYIKSRVTGGAISLFYSDFDDSYKRCHPDYFYPGGSLSLEGAERTERTERKRPHPSILRWLPINRRYMFNPLWVIMGRLHRFITENRMSDMLWDWHRRESYTAFRQRFSDCVQSTLTDQSTDCQQELRFIVFTSLFGVQQLEQLSEPLRSDASKIRELTDLVLEAVVIFTDAMFDFCSPSHSVESVARASYPLPLLLPDSTEEDQAIIIRPQLQSMDLPLLRALCQLSDKKKPAVERSYQERRQRMTLLEQCVCNHAFLFMSLYDLLYKPSEQLESLTFPNALTLMQRMNLSLNSGNC